MSDIQIYQPQAVRVYRSAQNIRSIEPNSVEHAKFLDAMDKLAQYMGITQKQRAADEFADTVATAAEFIRQRFGDMNPLELIEAFSMASAGELTMTNERGQCVPVSAETFQSFSMPYIGKILGAYRDHRRREVARWNMQGPKNEPKQLAEAAPDALAYVMEKAELGELPLFTDWGRAFKQLEDAGEITMTTEEKQVYFDKVSRMELKSERERKGKFRIDVAKIEGSVKAQCQKLLVLKWAMSKYPNAKYPFHIEFPK
jgi:hypothetical protein